MKINKLLIISMLICIGIISSNCTVQKRSYRSGYYVSWNKKTVPVLKIAKHTDEKNSASFQNEISKPETINTTKLQEPLFASVEKLVMREVKRLKVKPLMLAGDSCNDVITLRDGKDITVKVIEVSSKFIKYKRCDNLTGPLIVVNTDNVFMIKYANGSKEVFKKSLVLDQDRPNQTSEQIQIKPAIEKKYNDMAIASLATFILYFTIILAPLPFIFGLIALNQFKKNPEKYKGKWMAIVGATPGIIALCILLLLMLTFII